MPYGTFEEHQRFTQIWLWVVIIGVSIIILLQVPLEIIHQTGEEPMSTTNIIVLTVSMLFVIGLIVLFYFARLTTKITNERIEIIYRPFFIKPKVFLWQNIEEAYVRKYNSMWEFGGWGIRYSWKGRAYNTSGNQGLQLIMKNGKKY